MINDFQSTLLLVQAGVDFQTAVFYFILILAFLYYCVPAINSYFDGLKAVSETRKQQKMIEQKERDEAKRQEAERVRAEYKEKLYADFRVQRASLRTLRTNEAEALSRFRRTWSYGYFEEFERRYKSEELERIAKIGKDILEKAFERRGPINIGPMQDTQQKPKDENGNKS